MSEEGLMKAEGTKKKDTVEENKKSKLPCWFWPAIGVVFVICLGFGCGIGWQWSNFEAISALFTGWAFIGMLAALFMQREELSLQRQQLQLTHEELAKSAKAAQQTAEANERAALNTLKAARVHYLCAELNIGYDYFNRLPNHPKTLMDQLQDPLADIKAEIDRLTEEVHGVTSE